MRYVNLIIGLIIISTFGFSCGPKPPKTKGKPKAVWVPSLSALSASSFNGETVLKWKTDRDINQPFGGYDIYIVPSEGIGKDDVSKFNDSRYPGDTDADPQTESFQTTDVKPGFVYRAWVIAYSLDGSAFSTSDTVLFRPLMRGEFTLNLRYSKDSSGYDFSRGKYVPARSRWSDILFFAGKGKAKLSAPSKLDYGLSPTEFIDLGRELTFEKVREYPKREFSGKTSVRLKVGDFYILRTADNHFAELLCTDIFGEMGRMKAKFKYVYNTVKGSLIFH